MNKKTAILLVLLGCMAGAFCGNRGPLVLEPVKILPAVSGLALVQKGNIIRLEWSFPAFSPDNRTPLELEKISRVIILYSDLPLPEERFVKKADVYARIALKELTRVEGRTYTAALVFKAKDLRDKKYFFALKYDYAKSSSAMSPIVAIETLTPPPPIQNLTLSQEKKTLVLHWAPPSEGRKPGAAPLGYYIYRSVQSEKESAPMRRLNSTPLPLEYYEDADLRLEGEYAYAVSTALSPQVESELSTPVKIKIVDVFPPDTPQQLVTFTGPDHVMITWDAVGDSDLAFYRLYRKDKEEGQFQLIADGIKENLYKDFQTQKGQTYFYAVSAVDRHGNESEPSKTVRHQF